MSALGHWSTTVRSGSMTEEQARALAADLHDPAGLARAELDGEEIVFTGSATGDHALTWSCSAEERIRAHWRGYCDAALNAHEGERPKLRAVPVTITRARGWIEAKHRHHPSTVGAIAALAVARTAGRVVCGVALLGRPVSRMLQARRDDAGQQIYAEVTRVCTDGTPNACSFLYGAARRIARERGYSTLITYTLASESGASLRAAGWTCDGPAGGGDWSKSKRGRSRKVSAGDTGPKVRWSVQLRPARQMSLVARGAV